MHVAIAPMLDSAIRNPPSAHSRRPRRSSLRRARALDDLSLTIDRGEIFAFLGPNGGGKTTLFRLLSTLIPLQTGGSTSWASTSRRERRAVRQRIGVVFQAPASTRSSPWPKTSAPRTPVRACRASARGSLPARCSLDSAWPIARPSASKRSRAACGAASSWPRACCTGRGCCCWTSRAPASIPARAATVGLSCTRSPARTA